MLLAKVCGRIAGPSFSPDPDSTALHLAAANGHAAAVRVLLDYGFSKDKEDEIGRTALHIAAESGQTAVAKVLLIFVANPSRDVVENARPWAYDETPFHLAAKGGHVKVLAIFNKYVRSVDYPRTKLRQTALHFAASGGHDKAIRWLVKNGADVNAIDSNGFTPLQCALIVGSETAVYVLLKLGVKIQYLYPIEAWWGVPTGGWEEAGNLISALGAKFGLAAVAESSLRLCLESIRDSQRIGYESKRKTIVRLSRVLHPEKNVAVRKLLEQELRLYP